MFGRCAAAPSNTGIRHTDYKRKFDVIMINVSYRISKVDFKRNKTTCFSLFWSINEVGKFNGNKIKGKQ